MGRDMFEELCSRYREGEMSVLEKCGKINIHLLKNRSEGTNLNAVDSFY